MARSWLKYRQQDWLSISRFCLLDNLTGKEILYCSLVNLINIYIVSSGKKASKDIADFLGITGRSF